MLEAAFISLRAHLPDIVSHVMLGRLVNRTQPDRVDAELFKIGDLGGNSLQVTWKGFSIVDFLRGMRAYRVRLRSHRRMKPDRAD